MLVRFIPVSSQTRPTEKKRQTESPTFTHDVHTPSSIAIAAGDGNLTSQSFLIHKVKGDCTKFTGNEENILKIAMNLYNSLLRPFTMHYILLK